MTTTPIWWPRTELRATGTPWFFRKDEEDAGAPSFRINPMAPGSQPWTACTFESALAGRLTPVVGSEIDYESIDFASISGLSVEVLVRELGSVPWHSGWAAWNVQVPSLSDPVLVVHTRCGLWLNSLVGYEEATHSPNYCMTCLPPVPIPNSLTRELGHIADWGPLSASEDGGQVRTDMSISNIGTGTRCVYTWETEGNTIGATVFQLRGGLRLVGIRVDALPGVDVEDLQEATATAALTNAITLAGRYYMRHQALDRGSVRKQLGIDLADRPIREDPAERYRRVLKIHASAEYGQKAQAVMDQEPTINSLESARDLIKRALRAQKQEA